MTPEPSIGRVDPDLLDLALRICDIQVNKAILSRVLDVIVVLEVKGDEFDVMDAAKLKSNWGYLG